MQVIIRTAQTTLFISETIEEVEQLIANAKGRFIKVHDPAKNLPILIAIETINIISIIEDGDEL